MTKTDHSSVKNPAWNDREIESLEGPNCIWYLVKVHDLKIHHGIVYKYKNWNKLHRQESGYTNYGLVPQYNSMWPIKIMLIKDM